VINTRTIEIIRQISPNWRQTPAGSSYGDLVSVVGVRGFFVARPAACLCVAARRQIVQWLVDEIGIRRGLLGRCGAANSAVARLRRAAGFAVAPFVDRPEFQVLAQVAPDIMPVADVSVSRRAVPARRLLVITPGVKIATGRRIDGAGHIARQQDTFRPFLRIRYRDRRHQGFRVRVLGVGE
jgi:hypothetical protein